MTSRMSSVRHMYFQQTSCNPINSIGQHYPIDFMGLLLVRKLITLNKSHLFLLFPCYCQNVASQSFPKVAILQGKILRYCYMLVLFHQSKKFTAKISPKISRMEPRGVFHVKNFEIVNYVFSDYMTRKRLMESVFQLKKLFARVFPTETFVPHLFNSIFSQFGEKEAVTGGVL